MIFFEDNFPAWTPNGVNFKKNVTMSVGSTTGILNSVYEYTTTGLLAAATFVQNTAYPFYTFPNDSTTWKLINFSYRFTVQSTGASTFTVENAAAGVAPGSGTAQTGALSLQGTANTTINATLTAATTFAAGSSLNLVVSNTAATTGLVNFVGTFALQRLT